MSRNESNNGENTAENTSEILNKSKTMSDGETSSSSSGSLGHVASHSFAYDDEPLAEPGECVTTPDDADGILPSTLEQRSDCTIPV